MKGLTPEEYWVLSTTVGDDCTPECATSNHLPFSVTQVAQRLAERGLVTIHDCPFEVSVCHARVTALGVVMKQAHEVISK
jgi:hypothetical protein